MGMNADQYRTQLQALLPRGAFWNRDANSILALLLQGFSDEFARVDGRSDDLLAEFDPRTTSELLADWERVAGLPDKCITAIQTAQARRDALTAKLTDAGGQSRQYFIDLAAGLGYPITITEYAPFKAGLSQAGEPLTNGDWAFAWRVNHTLADNLRRFKAGIGKAGEPLGSSNTQALECVVNQFKPAHTFVSFAYT